MSAETERDAAHCFCGGVSFIITPDVGPSDMDTELFCRLKARRIALDQWEESGKHRSKAAKTTASSATDASVVTTTTTPTLSATSGSLKRPYEAPKNKQQLIDDLSQELNQQRLVCETQAKSIQQSQETLQERTTGFEAMVVLFKYITENLDGLKCPELKKRLAELTGQLNIVQQQLDGAVRLQRALETNMKMMKEQHQSELSSLRSAHEREMKDLEERLRKEAEQEREAVTTQHLQQLDSMQQQAENLVRGLSSFQHLSEMKVQHDTEVATVTQEYECRLDGLKSEFTGQLEALKKSYEARINNVTKHYEEIKDQLTEKNVQLHTDYQELIKRDHQSGISTPDCSRGLVPVLSHKLYLEQEVESLRAVMELRNQEIGQLRVHNDRMEKELEEIPKAQLTITALQQKIENLEAIINLKADYEKDLAEKHNVLLRKYDQETKAKKRLSMNNEELAYRLSQTISGSSVSEAAKSEVSPEPSLVRPKSVLASSGSNSTSSTPSKTRDIQTKSMITLSQNDADKPHSRLSGPPVSAKPAGIKLRRPKMFAGSPDENTSIEVASPAAAANAASDAKQDSSAFRQSDV